MKYRAFIEKYFLIDEPKTGKLVPFKFNKVQEEYYNQLIEVAGGEENLNISIPLREIILKARREGFTSFVLAMFAADMILNKEPTLALEISYKEDATKQHFRRFKGFIESYFRAKGVEDVGQIYSTDNKHEIILKENGAIFYVGTASARTGERGGTVQKLLFTEAAHFPDTEIMTAKEIILPTIRMVDIDSGWVFVESTANGLGNTYADMWDEAEKKISRFNARFFGWRKFYSTEQITLIRSEFTDEKMFMQEYPETPAEAFITFAGRYFTQWDPEIHICEPHEILLHLKKFICLDYGYAKHAAVYWCYKDADGVVYAYRELYGPGRTYKDLMKEIIRLTPVNEIIDYIVADPAIWAKKGESELSGAEIMEQTYYEVTQKNLMLLQANNDRLNGWGIFREHLKPIQRGEKVIARLQVFPQCVNLIRTIPRLEYDRTRVEDLDTDGEDHGVDAIRYGLMSRPNESPASANPVSRLLNRSGNGPRTKQSMGFQ